MRTYHRVFKDLKNIVVCINLKKKKKKRSFYYYSFIYLFLENNYRAVFSR